MKTQALCSKSLKDFKAGTAEQESRHWALLQAGRCTTAGVTGPGKPGLPVGHGGQLKPSSAEGPRPCHCGSCRGAEGHRLSPELQLGS